MLFFTQVLFNALDEVTGVAFTLAGDDHDVFGVNNYSFHTLSILCLYSLHRVDIYKFTPHCGGNHRLFCTKSADSL